jgi:hypothetical protein
VHSLFYRARGKRRYKKTKNSCPIKNNDVFSRFFGYRVKIIPLEKKPKNSYCFFLATGFFAQQQALHLCQHNSESSTTSSTSSVADSASSASAPKSSSSCNPKFGYYTRRNLIRVYPRGTRLLSSNMHPLPFWLNGCQMVALNYQGRDSPIVKHYSSIEYPCFLVLVSTMPYVVIVKNYS